jgi:hypothetical protein
MTITVRQAQRADVHVVEELLIEAARWVDALGEVMWEEGELVPGRIAVEVEEGQFFLAVVDGEPGGRSGFSSKIMAVHCSPFTRDVTRCEV